jgi:hypothetical protein
VTRRRLGIAVPVALLAVGLVCWFTVGDFRNWVYFGMRIAYFAVRRDPSPCKQRAAELTAKVDLIKRDAKNSLRVGTKKDDVARFFASENIPFTFDQIVGEHEARGTIYFKGLPECESVACGDDSALIGVQVNLSADGTVLSDPVVTGMYTNCL